MSDNRILQSTAITIVPSVADIFLTFSRNFHNSPSGFVFIRNKVFNANFRLFVDMISNVANLTRALR